MGYGLENVANIINVIPYVGDTSNPKKYNIAVSEVLHNNRHQVGMHWAGSPYNGAAPKTWLQCFRYFIVSKKSYIAKWMQGVFIDNMKLWDSAVQSLNEGNGQRVCSFEYIDEQTNKSILMHVVVCTLKRLWALLHTGQ